MAAYEGPLCVYGKGWVELSSAVLYTYGNSLFLARLMVLFSHAGACSLDT